MARGKYLRTLEHRQLQSHVHKGQPAWTKGKPMSEFLKKNLSEANRGKRCSQETRYKMILAGRARWTEEARKQASESRKGTRTGEKNPAWKGGISSVNQKPRGLPEYKVWRTRVFRRDDYTCVLCGLKNGLGKTVVLNADHIKPFSQFPELRFDITNGRTLCVPCHKKHGAKGNIGRPKRVPVGQSQSAVEFESKGRQLVIG